MILCGPGVCRGQLYQLLGHLLKLASGYVGFLDMTSKSCSRIVCRSLSVAYHDETIRVLARACRPLDPGYF